MTFFDFGDNSSHGFRVTGGLSAFGSVIGRLSVFCMSALSPGGAIHRKVSCVLSSLSPCARCCPRSSRTRLRRVLGTSFKNVKSLVACGRGLGHSVVTRPFRKAPTTGIKLGTNSVLVRVSKGSLTKGGGRRIDRVLQKTMNADFGLGIRHPSRGKKAQPLRFSVMHRAVRAPVVPCSAVFGGGMNCVGLDAFSNAPSGSFGGAFLGLGGRNVASLIVSLHNGNNKHLRRTMRVTGFFLPHNGIVMAAGKGAGRTDGACGALHRPLSLSVPVAMLIGNTATSTSRVLSKTFRSFSHTIVMNDHAFKGKLIRAAHPLPCKKMVGLAASGCCVPDKHYIRTVSCGRHGRSNDMNAVPSDLAAIFRATTNHRIHSKKKIVPSVRIGRRGLPGVLFCLMHSGLVFSCTARCYLGRPDVPSPRRFGIASTSCGSFGTVIGGTSFGCSRRDRGVVGALGRTTGFRNCLSRTSRRVGTLRGGLARGLSHSLSCFSGSVESVVTSRVVGHCCCAHNNVVRRLGSSSKLRTTLGVLTSPIGCGRALDTPMGGWVSNQPSRGAASGSSFHEDSFEGRAFYTSKLSIIGAGCRHSVK